MSSGFTHSTFKGAVATEVWARRWRITDFAALAIIVHGKVGSSGWFVWFRVVVVQGGVLVGWSFLC